MCKVVFHLLTDPAWYRPSEAFEGWGFSIDAGPGEVRVYEHGTWRRATREEGLRIRAGVREALGGLADQVGVEPE